MRIVGTYQFNQWDTASFWRQVEQYEQQEARIAAAYDKPIEVAVIRSQVLDAILINAVPAGNA